MQQKTHRDRNSQIEKIGRDQNSKNKIEGSKSPNKESLGPKMQLNLKYNNIKIMSKK